MSNGVVILYSGGADSRLMIQTALEQSLEPHCVLIDYEQLHIQELDFARKQLDKLKVSHQTVQLRGLNIDSGLTGDGVKGTYKDVHEMHVPSRNLMFVGIASSIAENMEYDKVWYGADSSDIENSFPDCMPKWVGVMNKVLEINGPNPIQLSAPLHFMTKEQIINKLTTDGIQPEEYLSGYGDL